MATSIRAMRPGDYAACRDLWTSDAHIHAGMAEDAVQFRRYLERNPGCSQVAVADDGTVVGTIAAGHDGFRGSCHHLIVTPDQRRQGTARALTDAALQALRAAGIERCFVWIYDSNAAGAAFWQGLGFQRWEECPTYSRRL